MATNGKTSMGFTDKDAAEYSTAVKLFQFFLEYRIKIFGFCIAFSGLALTVISRSEPGTMKVMISLFATVTTGVLWILEVRTIHLADLALKGAVDKEKEFSMRTMTNLQEANGVRQKYMFWAIYGTLLAFWIIISIVWTIEAQGATK